MPARKPASLIVQHLTKREREDRSRAESAMMPKTPITARVPESLKGHARASAVWKYTLALYVDMETPIVTAFDRDLLVDYCLSIEQLVQIEDMRAQAIRSFELIAENLKAVIAKAKRKDPKQIIAEQLAIAQKMADILDQIMKLDARVDRKRSLIHTLRQSLYLTPRSRAGVAPEMKEEDVASEMELLLGEVRNVIGA
jgi:hypothetical protein